MTATYWEIGRRIVEHEQGGAKRAGYGEELLARLAEDLMRRFGRGFSRANLERMRLFYLVYGDARIPATLSRESSPEQESVTLSRESDHPADDAVRLLAFASEPRSLPYTGESADIVGGIPQSSDSADGVCAIRLRGARKRSDGAWRIGAHRRAGTICACGKMETPPDGSPSVSASQYHS